MWYKKKLPSGRKENTMKKAGNCCLIVVVGFILLCCSCGVVTVAVTMFMQAQPAFGGG